MVLTVMEGCAFHRPRHLLRADRDSFGPQETFQANGAPLYEGLAALFDKVPGRASRKIVQGIALQVHQRFDGKGRHRFGCGWLHGSVVLVLRFGTRGSP